MKAKQTGLDQLVNGAIKEESSNDDVEVDEDADKKPCPKCGCLSPVNRTHALAGEVKMWTCPSPDCELPNFTFRKGWNERRKTEDFLNSVEIDGWELE